jgi:hypothetical protein
MCKDHAPMERKGVPEDIEDYIDHLLSREQLLLLTGVVLVVLLRRVIAVNCI